MVKISIHKPTGESLQTFLEQQSSADFSYDGVGGTFPSATLPPGYIVDRTRLQLGLGQEIFHAATAALKPWEQFHLGWVEAWPPTAPLSPGQVIIIQGYAIGLWWSNASRIVYAIDEPTRFGFAYGTLPSHIEKGEERFLIEWDQTTDQVWFNIMAFSRPNHFASHIGQPWVRRKQKRFGRESAARMFRAVDSSSPLPVIVQSTDRS